MTVILIVPTTYGLQDFGATLTCTFTKIAARKKNMHIHQTVSEYRTQRLNSRKCEIVQVSNMFQHVNQ